ncbi:MAG TPA: aldo/keto reductase [Gaiellaceae bacterium]|nr:aldo/keto reductase [Gaiellaceae bacterium]
MRSRLGLGLAALGRPGYINLGHGEDLASETDVPALESRAHAVLDAALAGGVEYFDAARSYGRAEEFLGTWLHERAIGPADVTVASKWGYTYTAGWRVDAEQHEVKDLSLENLTRQFAESRALLGDHLQLYQIHSATLESGVLDDRPLLAELARLREAGLHIGLTVSGPRQRETIERVLEVGGFDAVQATWNLYERSAGPTLAAAEDAGLAVIVKEALANGRLTGRGGDARLLAAAEKRGVPPDALALAATLAQPWACVVLSGAATVRQLESNLGARTIDNAGGLDEELASLTEDRDDYWATRAGLSWN